MQPAPAKSEPSTIETMRAKFLELWNRMPRSLQFAAPIALLLTTALAIYLLWGVGESFVTLQLHHSFKSAEVQVLVDGSVKHSASISGSSNHKLFGARTVGVYQKALALRPGHHTIEVRVSSGGVDQSRSISGDFTRDAETILDVSSVKAGMFMSLRQPTQHGEATTSSAIRGNPMTSMLFTLSGSVLSAIVGFYVQEFLKKRKAKQA